MRCVLPFSLIILLASTSCLAQTRTAQSGITSTDPITEFGNDMHAERWRKGGASSVQLGPRPFFLVDDMSPGPLRDRLQQCANRKENYRPSLFSIGHRGAPMQFPEHTRESYIAAARMGAGVLECDVTFTKDKQLVCRHAQDDLHTTTNILATPLAAKCTKPFTPAQLDTAGNVLSPASAECRTSDITLAEFKTLRGKMDAFNPRARTVAEYLDSSSGTLMTHRESIELFRQLNVDMTPELKAPVVTMPFDGFSQEQYAQKLINEYVAAGIAPSRVWPQSFNKADVLYWVWQTPRFGLQAVYLDDANTPADLPSASELKQYRQDGIRIVAPPVYALLTTDTANRIVPSSYARNARAAGLNIITWTVERSGILADGNNGFYFQTFDSAIRRDGDVYQAIDVLARDVGVIGIFSDWPATTSFYANCMRLR
jgi:glycerophosphoryl diester phosphodiesterase